MLKICKDHFPEWKSSVFYLFLFVNLISVDYFISA